MGFLERLRQENQKLASESAQARIRKEQQQLIKRQNARNEEAKTKQVQAEAISRARNFLRESNIVSLLEAARNNLSQIDYNFIDLKLHKKDNDELNDYSLPYYTRRGDVVVIYRWGKRDKNLYGGYLHDYHGFPISVSGDGDINISHHHYVGWHTDDCPPERFSSTEWRNNRDLLEDSLWAAYKNPFPLNESDERRRGLRKGLRSQPDPWRNYEGRGPCLAGNSFIGTPSGFVLIKDIKIGDYVYTVDISGRRVQTVIVKKTKRPVAKNHKMVQLVLEGGRKLFVSPGHPTFDYKMIGSLVKRDKLDGSYVDSIKVLSYKGKYTYDILPYGVTGAYWANGILIGSTLSGQFETTALGVLYKPLGSIF